MTTYDQKITELAIRTGRAEAEAEGLREEVETLRGALDLAERRFAERLDAAEGRVGFAQEQLAVSRNFAEQRLAKERAARLAAEAERDLLRGEGDR